MDSYENTSENGFDVVWWTIFIILILVVVALIIFFTLRKAVLFQPTKDVIWKPDDYQNLYLIVGDKSHNDGKGYSFKEIKDIRYSKVITFSDLQYINVWYMNKFLGAKVVLYFHGNNDNITYREYAFKICERLKLNLILIDYRGYGKSSSYPSTKFILQDADTVYSFAKLRCRPEDIIIWGESLGGIAAIYTASKYPCDKLVLLSTFYNLNTVLDKMKLPETIKNIIKRLSKDKYIKNHKWIKDVICPTIIIHSTEDDILPYVNGEKLYEKSGSITKHFIKIHGAHSHPHFNEDNVRDLFKALGLASPDVFNEENTEALIEIINNLE